MEFWNTLYWKSRCNVLNRKCFHLRWLWNLCWKIKHKNLFFTLQAKQTKCTLSLVCCDFKSVPDTLICLSGFIEQISTAAGLLKIMSICPSNRGRQTKKPTSIGGDNCPGYHILYFGLANFVPAKERYTKVLKLYGIYKMLTWLILFLLFKFASHLFQWPIKAIDNGFYLFIRVRQTGMFKRAEKRGDDTNLSINFLSV